jgi:predicted nucleic acid-binding protein
VIVVADTSPLNYLILLGHSELLSSLFGRVLAPEAVLIEMQHPDAPPDVRIWAASPPPWLERAQVKSLDKSLAVELGMGEREAISLALERHADVLLIDELAGRREAVTRHLTVAGTLAVLLQAALLGYLDLPTELDRLRNLGFYVARSLETGLLARYAQQKRAR